jgi:hypothetical protein
MSASTSLGRATPCSDAIDRMSIRTLKYQKQVNQNRAQTVCGIREVTGNGLMIIPPTVP